MGEPRSETSVGEVIVAARPDDPLGLEVSRTIVAAQLFGVTGGPQLGRFQLLNRLGAGGMGVVYAAYDPHLDRTVAVKLVRASAANGPAAMEEGRALARLSHPNVVPVFEVGYSGDHIYIVMELVLGRTLRRWVSGRRVRDIVRAYRQAGEGLAAAHAVGLVHRDFKPDNAIMGGDGRVRVVDFGLAHAAEAEVAQRAPGRGAGTPKYMAPEQIAGGPITGAVDQYGLCASLRDALADAGATSRRSPPARWIKAIIERGCASDPKERFPSMAELVAALGRDPAAVRRRRIAAVVVAAVAALLFVTGRSTVTDRAPSCAAGEARITTAWGSQGREAAVRPLERLGRYGRSVAGLLVSQARAYEERWTSGYRSVCLAHQAGVESDSLRDRRMACLETGRRSLAAFAATIGTTDQTTLGNLVRALRALPDPSTCSDGRALIADTDVPGSAIAGQVAEVHNQIAATRIRLAAGHLREARSEAEKLVAETRALAYAPLLAEALLLEGHATAAMDERAAAIGPLTEAYTLAFKVGDQPLAVEAWARRAWAQGTSTGGDAALMGSDIVQAVADQQAVPGFARALLYNNIGAVQMALDHRDRARLALERAAREAVGVAGPGATELLVVPVNLALVTEDTEKRGQLLTRAVAATAELLGADHPDTAAARWLQGDYTTRFADALEILAPTCSSLRPANDVLAKHCWTEVAFIRGELKQTGEAIAALTSAAAIQVAPDSDAPSAAPYLRYWQGDFETAADEFATVLRGLPRLDPEPWWDRQTRADLEIGLARSLLALGRARAARAPLESAVQGLLGIEAKAASPAVERRLGRAQAELAKTLAVLRALPDQIRAHAAPAAAWLRTAGGLDSEIRTFERLALSLSRVQPTRATSLARY